MRTLEIDNESRCIIFDGVKLSARWTLEAENDLKKFHGVDISREIALALVDEIDRECNLTDDERQYCFEQIKGKFDGSI